MTIGESRVAVVNTWRLARWCRRIAVAAVVQGLAVLGAAAALAQPAPTTVAPPTTTPGARPASGAGDAIALLLLATLFALLVVVQRRMLKRSSRTFGWYDFDAREERYRRKFGKYLQQGQGRPPDVRPPTGPLEGHSATGPPEGRSRFQGRSRAQARRDARRRLDGNDH